MTEKHIAAEWKIPLQGVQKTKCGSSSVPPAAESLELRTHLAQQSAAERLFAGSEDSPLQGTYLNRFNCAHSKSRSRIAQSVGCFTVRQQYRAGRLLQIVPTPKDGELIVPTPFVPLHAQPPEIDTQSL